MHHYCSAGGLVYRHRSSPWLPTSSETRLAHGSGASEIISSPRVPKLTQPVNWTGKGRGTT